MRLTLLLIFSAVVLNADDKPLTADALLERSRGKYAALKSYSDTGVVVTESNGGSPTLMKERNTFTTYFRVPKQFFFDFRADPSASGDRFVLWIDGAEVNTWWQATGVHDKYPQGQGAAGFANGSLPTKGSIATIASLLFPGLQGPFADLKDTRLVSSEAVGGHRCYKVVGDFAPAYGNGTVTSTSAVTVWIDSETLLIRKIFADTPKESPASVIDRTIITLEPRANPELKPTLFRFSVPSTK